MKGDRKERNKRAQSERGKEGERGGDYLIYNFFYQNAIPSIYSGFFLSYLFFFIGSLKTEALQADINHKETN